MENTPNISEDLLSSSGSTKISLRWWKWLDQFANYFNNSLTVKNLTVTGVESFTQQTKVIQGPNSSGIYLNWSGDGYFYLDSQNGFFFRKNGGAATLGQIDVSGNYIATGNFYAAGGAYYSDNGATKQFLEDLNDGWLRLNQLGDFSNGLYTPNNLRVDGIVKVGGSNYFQDAAASGQTYGSFTIHGGYNAYYGIGLADGGRTPTFMSNGSTSGIYNQGSGYWFIYDDGTNTNVHGALIATGDVEAFSDRRLKKDIRPIRNALSKIDRLQGVLYRLKEGDESDHMGLIAQEVESVAPEVVHKRRDDTLTIAYGNLVALCIEAIKELKKEVEEIRRGTA